MQRPSVSPQRPAVAPPLPPGVPSTGNSSSVPICDLCKAAKSSVRCDRCDNQVFCLQCDDIFHRHPKRKTHLRKTVESNPGRPPAHQGTLSGHTVVSSTPFWKQQPNIPPRKKKPFSIFTNLMKGKSEVSIPEEIDKRSTLSSKLGSLKRFIQNRPLPPLPSEDRREFVNNTEEPRRNAFASLHNKSSSSASLSRGYQKESLSDFEDEGRMGSNLQVNRMYPDQINSMNRHQSMMDLSRMAPHGYPPYMTGSPFMPPFGAPFGGMPAPYGSMSYVNDPRMMPQPWGYAGSFSNLNSSAEGEGRDTDNESMSRMPTGASMRRCQSFASNQWTNMAYPFVPPQQQFGYPAMPPYVHPAACGSQWGSNQSMEGMGMPGYTNAHPSRNPANLSNMDANRAIWYYHNRNKQRSMKAETETSDSDMDFVPKARSRSDHQAYRQHSSDRDQHRKQSPHASRTSRGITAAHESRRGRQEDSGSRATSVGASDFDDDIRFIRGNTKTYPERQATSPPSSFPDEEYIDRIEQNGQEENEIEKFNSPPPPQRASTLPRRPSYEKATRDDCERLQQRLPMSPPRQRKSSNQQQMSSVPPQLPSKKQSEKLASSRNDPQTHKEQSKPREETETRGQRELSEETEEADRIRWSPSKQWTCIHCTFINSPGKRVCDVCCKTSFKDPTPEKSAHEQKKPENTTQCVVNEEICQEPKKDPPKAKKPANSGVKKTTTKQKGPVEKEELDGFDYEFVKQQREVEQELRRRLENERRIAAENALLEGSGEAKGNPHDTYETVQFTSEAESESEPESIEDRKSDQQPSAKSITSRFEKKIQQTKEASPAVVGPYRRMMVDANGVPKSLSSINQARSKFESPTESRQPRKSSLKTSDFTPSSSRTSSIASEETPLDQQTAASVRPKQPKKHPKKIALKTQQPVEHSDSDEEAESEQTEEQLEENVDQLDEEEQEIIDLSPRVVEKPSVRKKIPIKEKPSEQKSQATERHQQISPEPKSTQLFEFASRSFKSVADLVEEQRREIEMENALMLMNAIKEGEAAGFSAEDVQIARVLCGDANPVLWLKTNWAHMIETVIHLSNSYVAENALENVGQLSVLEAQGALRRHSGNIWNSVIDAVEKRQKAAKEILEKGPFKPDDVLQTLRVSQGNVDQALAQLSNSTMNVFLMKMYSAGADNLSRSGSQNTVAPDEKISMWLENAARNSSRSGGSSTISSSSESLNLLAGPDQQLQKLDKLMMKRQLQKKEDTKYKKYKERVAYARQHHEGSSIAETGYFEKSARSVSSPETSISRQTTNIEDVIEQKIQTGLNTILSAIETSFKKEKVSVSEANEDTDDEDGEEEVKKRTTKKRGSGSSSEKSGGRHKSTEIKEAGPSKANASKSKQSKENCKPQTKPRKKSETDSDEGEVFNENPGPSKQETNTTSQKVEATHLKNPGGKKYKQPSENLSATRVIHQETKSDRVIEKIISASSATDESDGSGERDYSEVELAIATVTQPVVIKSPSPPPKIELPNNDSDESDEEFEPAEEFHDAPQSPEIQGAEADTELYSEVQESVQAPAPDDEPEDAERPDDVLSGPTLPILDNPGHHRVDSNRRVEPQEPEEISDIVLMGPTLPILDNPGHGRVSSSSDTAHPPASPPSMPDDVLMGPTLPHTDNPGHSKTNQNGNIIQSAAKSEKKLTQSGQKITSTRANEVSAKITPTQIPLNNKIIADQPNQDALVDNVHPVYATTDDEKSQEQSKELRNKIALDSKSIDSAEGHLSNSSKFEGELSDHVKPAALFSEVPKSPMRKKKLQPVLLTPTVIDTPGHVMEFTITLKPRIPKQEEDPVTLTLDETIDASNDTAEPVDEEPPTQDRSEEEAGAHEQVDEEEQEPMDQVEGNDDDDDDEQALENMEDEEEELLSEDHSMEDDDDDGNEENDFMNTSNDNRDINDFLAEEDAYWANQDTIQQEESGNEEAEINEMPEYVEQTTTEQQIQTPEAMENSHLDENLPQNNESFEQQSFENPESKQEDSSENFLQGISAEEQIKRNQPKKKIIAKKKSVNKKTALSNIENEKNNGSGTSENAIDSERKQHNSDDYSDVSDEGENDQQRGNLASQTAMMKVIRRSLEDLARFGGKPQKVASRHVVYRRPSIRRRSTIVVVDKGDGFGRSSDGDAIIIKPQGGLERTLRVSGQELTKAILNMVTKQRSRPPPRRKVAEPSKLEQQMADKAPPSRQKQKQFNDKADALVASGRVGNFVQAQMVAELVDMNFDEDDAILASSNTDSVYQAVLFLQQECNICTGTYPMSQMVALLHCAHVTCRDCSRAYFTIQIKERNVGELHCPFCHEPDLSDEKIEQTYFSNMSVLLKDLLDKDVFELFQKKLVERALMKDPNFRWCPQCSSGFITVAQQKSVTCPDCKATSCAECKKMWRKEHQSMTCQEFDVWQSKSEPDSNEVCLERYFEDNGIQCPECKFRYALSRGGCMHFKCVQCGFDFCSGCNRPFKNGEKCGFSVNCKRLGLHAHHPRHCLFYLRDREHDKLEFLLKDSGVAFNRDPPSGQENQTRCQVPETKESAFSGYKDDICGRMIEQNMSGLCKRHYIEYLGGLIFKNKIDPLPIFETEELELCIRRANMRLPSRYQLTDAVYKDVLRKIVREDIPLDKIDPKQK